MSFDRGRHEAWEELISAALTGDIGRDEQRRLDAHLAGCASCRSTFDAFADQRRIVSGLRHIAPPRDLGARVRAGIETGRFAATPWWRRPPAIFAGIGGSLAVVAGALFALVLVNDRAPDPEVGRTTPSPIVSPSVEPVSDEPSISFEPVPTPTPAVTLPPAMTPGPSTAPDPSATPMPITTPPALAASPEPDLYLAVTGEFDNQALLVVASETGDTLETGEPPAAPIAAALSDDGQWLAYVTLDSAKGTQQVRVTRVTDGTDPDRPDAEPPLETPIEVTQTVVLGESLAGSPFLERLSWSADRRFLAYTLAEPEDGSTDAWAFDVTTGERTRLTDTGSAFAGSFVSEDDGSTSLWISAAGDEPVSYLSAMPADGPELVDLEEIDPADTVENAFQPLVSPNGSFAIYWSGRMDRLNDLWAFSEGGAPWLSEQARDAENGAIDFPNERLLFSDVTVGREAFTSAAIAWGPGGYTFVVWDATWTGVPQAPDEDYPAANRVYFGSVSDGGLGRSGALDAGDLPEDARVIDVKISPTGRHLLVTIAYPVAGDLEAPTADLLIIERSFDGGGDDVQRLAGNLDGWIGPAAFSDRWSNDEAP